ncbi:MAG: uroporphyrinogen-III C-methyltransferase [Gammaproteobacteria bacterium]|nr:uroporphyrinogen-III C-methyltransferase [Gammaproteobacteria bacterium]
MIDNEEKQLGNKNSGEELNSRGSLTAEGEGHKRKGSGTSPLPLVLALFALVGLTAVSTAAFFFLKSAQQDVRELENRIEEGFQGQGQLSDKLGELRTQLGTQADRIAQQQATFDEYAQLFRTERDHYELGRKEMLAAVNALQRRLGRSTSRWMAAEAEYLIRVANYRVQLESDAATALSALKAADERLRDSGDPLWTPVRNQLAEDIAALQAVTPLDREGVSARLFALSRQVERLKLSESLLSHPKKLAEQASQQEFSFDNLLRDGVKGFKSLLVVRRHNRPVTAMLPPEQEFFLGHNMRLQLEAARLALLRADQALFDASLKSAMAWLDAFYDREDTAVSVLRDGLSELAPIQVRPKLPDISASLALMRKQAEEADASPPPAPEEQGAPPLPVSPAQPGVVDRTGGALSPPVSQEQGFHVPALEPMAADKTGEAPPPPVKLRLVWM